MYRIVGEVKKVGNVDDNGEQVITLGCVVESSGESSVEGKLVNVLFMDQNEYSGYLAACVGQSTPDLVLAQKIVGLLNDLLDMDRPAVGAMFAMRVPCNEALADHPTVQAGKQNGGFNVGILGVLNGLCGTYANGWGAIAAVFEQPAPGQLTDLVRFEVLPEERARNVNPDESKAFTAEEASRGPCVDERKPTAKYKPVKTYSQTTFEAKVGVRASVITDEGFLVGTGKVTLVAERTEVIFDNGSGGMFPNRFICQEVKENDDARQ